MKKWIAITMILLLSISMLAGCGAKFNSVAEIRQNGKITLLTEAGFAPFEYYDGTEVTGVDIALGQMIAEELGVKLEIVDMYFDGLISALNSGKGDFVAAGMTADESRAKEVDFTVTYVKMGLAVVVPAEGSSVSSFADMAGKRIAVQTGTTADIYASEQVESAEVLRFKAYTEAATAVKNGSADCAIIDLLAAVAMCKASDGKLVKLEGVCTEEDIAIAVAKGNSELLEVINKVLREAIDSGTVDALVDEHIEHYEG